MTIAPAIAHDLVITDVIRRLRAAPMPLSVAGLWGSSAPLVAAVIASAIQRPLLFITAHAEAADEAADDLHTFLGRRPDVLPAWELRPGEGAASDEVAAERTRLCALLRDHAVMSGAAGDKRKAPKQKAAARPVLIAAPIQSLMQPVPTPTVLDRNALALRVGQSIDPRMVQEWLTQRGMTRLPAVESAGDFAVRGDILDVHLSAAVDPVRVEFFGDEIESIRRFSLQTQRSSEPLQSVRLALPPKAAHAAADDTTSFLSYLPTACLMFIHEPGEITELGRTLLDRLGMPVGMFPVEAVLKRAGEFSPVYLSRFESSAAPAESSFYIRTDALPAFETKALDAIGQLVSLAGQHAVSVFCDNEGEQQRLSELLAEAAGQAAKSGSAAGPVNIEVGWIRQGFVWRGGRQSNGDGMSDDVSAAHAAKTGVLWAGHHELFHRERRRRQLRRLAAARPIESFLDLEAGDYVVHTLHGIARYLGLKTIVKEERGKTEEFLTLQFAEDAVLHVPATQIELVQKYVGPGTTRPQLSTLGGTRWKNAKARVEEAVTDFAGDLLLVQAQRESREGISFPDDTHWQREFEAAFLFTETPDQTKANRDIKADMRNRRPMDRLLCGDVGYGKTELAMRAVFKAVEFGKQAAVLVPTTVLAEQHYRSFCERMADYPFVVDRVSRFRSSREMSETLRNTHKGHVDVLIGTHRLLSKDVRFADLGLVVIDEEQRFGVEHKERLKQLRSEVDVLTLTATPIPRTLHMAMVGLRDISALETPPLDRRSIQTRVAPWSDELIREAVIGELNRDGQVFFVHNRVKSIDAIRAKLATIVPEARFLVGHGQMPGEELEDVMMRFMAHEADVLVCTSIIESGIDIPIANTMIIDRADMFGLADLHQLRGRVGRYKHRAYCHLLMPADKPLTPAAARRLKAIEEFSDLGSGFRIAMRDLEIRGAGNILGEEQSGHIAAVGYEMYCTLLEAAVRRMKGLAPDAMPDCHLELDIEAYVPKDYADNDRQRMDIYRRVSACRKMPDVEQLERDLIDAYGKPPKPLDRLLAQTELRVRAAGWKIRAIVRKPPDFIFTVAEPRLVDRMFKGSGGSVRVADANTLYWRVPDKYFTPDTMIAVLRRLLSKPMA